MSRLSREDVPVWQNIVIAVSVALAFGFATHYFDPGFNIVFLFISLAFVLVALCFECAAGGTRSFTKARVLSLAVLLALTVHQLFITRSPDSSFPILMTMAAIPLLAIVISPSNGRSIFLTVFAVVAAMTFYSCVRFLVFSERAFYPLADPNNYVTLLYLAWIPWLHQQLIEGEEKAHKHRDFLLAVGSFVFPLAMLATHSRFAWVVLLAIFAFWGIGLAKRQITSRVFMVALIGALAAVTAYLGVDAGVLQESLPVGSAEAIEGGSETQGAGQNSHRLLLLKAVWQMYSDLGSLSGVLFGFGIYTFSLLYPAYRDLGDQTTAGLFVHNDYAQVAFEGGLLLLVPLLLLGAVLVLRLVQALMDRTRWDGRIGFVLAVAIAGLHANLNFVIYVLPLTVLLGICVGMAFVAPEATEENEGTPDQDRVAGIRKYSGILPVAWLVMGLAVLSVDVYNLGVFSGQRGVPGAQAIRTDAERMDVFIDRSLTLNPDRGLPYLARAELARMRGGVDAETLDGLYMQAVVADTYNPLIYVRYAELYLDEPERREGLLRQAVRLNPQEADYARVLIEHLHSQGKSAEDELVSIGQWCELIGMRDPQKLDQIGRLIAGAQGEDRPELREVLARCKSARMRDLSSKSRNATWLQRLVMG